GLYPLPGKRLYPIPRRPLRGLRRDTCAVDDRLSACGLHVYARPSIKTTIMAFALHGWHRAGISDKDDPRVDLPPSVADLRSIPRSYRSNATLAGSICAWCRGVSPMRWLLLCARTNRSGLFRGCDDLRSARPLLDLQYWRPSVLCPFLPTYVA